MARRAGCLVSLLLLGCATEAPAAERVIESFEMPGRFHRVSAAGLVEYAAEDGRSYLKCTTPGDGQPVRVANRRPYDPPLDFTGRFARLRLRASDVTRLSAMEFHLVSDAERAHAFVLRVPVFADEEFNLLQSGDWVTVTLGFGAARAIGVPDRSAIREIVWLVRDTGAPGDDQPLEVSWGGISAVDAPEAGVVSLTFDDGHAEHVSVAAPALARHGFRATAYVMPEQVDDRNYMNLQELRALRDRYGWDVAAHHAQPYTHRSPAELERVIRETRSFLTEHGFGDGADHLAYPLGKYDTHTVLPLVRRYFRTARLASAGPETLPPGDPHRLRAINVLSTTEPEEIRDAARRAMADGEWLILMFHYLVEAPARETEYPVERFLRLLEQLAADGARVRTVSEVWREYGAAARPADAAP